MKSKNVRFWLILSPAIIFSIIFIIGLLLAHLYQKELFEKLELNTNTITESITKSELDNKIIKSFMGDMDIFETKSIFDIPHLRRYFEVNFSYFKDPIFIAQIKPKERSIRVLFSNDKKIETKTYELEEKTLALDLTHFNTLTSFGELFYFIAKNDTTSIYRLCKYYPNNNLIVGISIEKENHELVYKKYIDSILTNLDSTRNLIFGVEFILMLLGTGILCLLIKRGLNEIERSKNELKNANLELTEANKTLEQRLYVDHFTGLPNKYSMLEDIKKMNEPKLIIVDIDDYYHMNEYFKQDMVQKMIVYIKQYLHIYVKEFNQHNLKLYRIDAAQFALLENAPVDMDRYEFITFRLARELKGVRILDNTKNNNYLEFNCTIGFSLQKEKTYETAVTALRRAKEKEKDCVGYVAILGEEDKYKKQMEGADFIKKALEKNQIEPFFQPICDANKNILKYETLMRIVSEDGKVIPPYFFLEASKKIKRYEQIEKIVLTKAFDMIENTNTIISVNLSLRDLIDSSVKNFIIDEILKRKIAKQIIFEIVEDEGMEAYERVSVFISRAKAMGVRIAVDDFGSGYSNFSYMLSLKPDYVKIDGTLIKNLEHDPISAIIVKSIIFFAKRLGIRTIAEYVHNEAVFNICKDLEIDEFQGFYLGAPIQKI